MLFPTLNLCRTSSHKVKVSHTICDKQLLNICFIKFFLMYLVQSCSIESDGLPCQPH